ncbi:haloalkane dehalogenase-like [Raphidocelis subcapitata]|uniref:Haloalkane dehalogenase-like n=1 Tax=Raphidocelis subcapitata TaxID=307507 RepID=A0A2V0PGQ3_9CHLO|nr:haloalkane dehalogenase-like [Raphidocelis subcapitata]|eukprot:GBF97090.1 haloalkane dehalogenase-like [Raphidocelis subcapitata]
MQLQRTANVPGRSGSLRARGSDGRVVVAGRGSAVARAPTVSVRAVEVESDVDGEIDPMTGMVIARTSTLNPVAGYTLQAGGLDWAYRRNEVDAGAAAAAAGLADVLLLHGLGSSSYSYRNTLALLGGSGVSAVAPDWPGHGDSAKPAPGGKFDYSEAAYTAALDSFVAAVDLKKPLTLVVQGFVLSQYALLWAAEHPGVVGRLLILNTPLAASTKLRPELAAYKNPIPFLRPKPDAPFDGTLFNMSGSPYAMQVDDAYTRWRQPTLLLWGSNDPFMDARSAFDFLETKRTNMKTTTVAAKLGHCPQEDFAEALHDPIMSFLRGEEPKTSKVAMRMTKRGLEGM